MIEVWAERIAYSIKRADKKGTASVAVLKYALTIVINYLIPVLLALCFGLLTNRLPETALSVFTFSLIRAASGGFHFKSSTTCMIVTTLICTIPPHIPITDMWSVIFTSISFIFVLIFAPANIKGYARMPERFFPIMKVISLILVGFNFVLNSHTFSIILIVQAILLLPIGKEVNGNENTDC